MTVVLTYTKLDGSKHKAGIDENISKIGFNYDNMISIDLSGIGECKNLLNNRAYVPKITRPSSFAMLKSKW